MSNGRRKKDPELFLSVEEITPAIAAEWLEVNSWNRKISERQVMIYAETMKEGGWCLNGEPIIFDYKGRLQSGQHRLLAVIESGVTIKSVVVRGAEPENIYSLESGRRRRMTDVLTLAGETDCANLAAALSWTWRWENKLMDRGGEVPTHTHQLRVLTKNPTLRDDLTRGRQVFKAFRVSVGVMTALYHQFYKIDPMDADLFWESLVTGENLHADHPCMVLRKWLIRSKQLLRRPTVTHTAAVTVKAWNKYRRHETVRTLSWRPEEAFPEAE